MYNKNPSSFQFPFIENLDLKTKINLIKFSFIGLNLNE